MKSLRQMDKENNRSAAGLRRSALVERIRLREEWSELKGISDNMPIKQQHNPPSQPSKKINSAQKLLESTRPTKVVKNKVTSDVLCGVVALVEVGAESRALALRAALTALGATVVPVWSALVTHLIWSEGGCRATRAKARALASRLVSPLWVEACAASNRRLPEQAFPAAARASDLPSPRTLRRLLKRAEMENIPLVDLLLDNSNEEDKQKAPRLRISSDTDPNTSADQSADTSHDKSRDSTDVTSRVNTAPRGNRPGPASSRPVKSKRKLFTHREAHDITRPSGDDTDEESSTRPKQMKAVKLTQSERRDLARAERMAKRLVATCRPKETQNVLTQSALKPRVVLTGMSRLERTTVFNAIKSLNGLVQKQVNRKTSHILLGSCQGASPVRNCSNNDFSKVPGISGTVNSSVKSISDVSKNMSAKSDIVIPRCDKKCRTLNALEGAARGCRVLYAQWAIDSMKSKQWLHHYGYEVTHLRKIAQKARAERAALQHLRSEYAYNIFYGMRVYISDDADQKDAVTRLLTLCGAVVIQNGRCSSAACDLTIGTREGAVSSKWVFDSIAASRMRTTRRYINNPTTISDNIMSTHTAIR